MHSPKLLSSLPSLVLTCTTFLSFGSFANAALKMDFTKVSTSPNMLVRRAGTLDVIAQKSLNWTLGGAYRTNITLGNPPQSMEVFLDTGSSNLALNTPTSCKDRPSDQLCLGGSFDPTKSRSYKALDQLPFNQTYIDGAGAQGIYATDDLSFAGITLRNATFGIAETPGYNTGFMGIGPDPDLYARKPLKKNISSTLDSLVAAEVTKSRLLSLYLDEISSSSGSIVFGGVDESKFDTSAGLVTLDILADPGTGAYDFYLIQMTNLSITSAGQSRALPISFSPSIPWMPTLVDSGASTVLVPPQIFSAINSYANAISPPSFDGAYGFPCSASQNETLKNTFLSWTPGDPLNPSVSITYNISLAELVVPFYVIGTTTPQTLNMDGEDTEVCLFGVQPSYSELDGLSVIGDPFLRRMYVVFDQDSREISFGYPVFNVEDSKVVEVLKVSDSPYAKKTESQSDADTLNKSLLNGFNATTSAPSGTSTAAVQTANAAAGLGVPHMGISTLVAAVMVFAAASGFAIGM